MESIIGLIIWVIIIIVIISRTIRQAGTHPIGKGAPDEKDKENKGEEQLRRVFETIFTGESPQEEEIPEETPEEIEISEPEPQVTVPVQIESKEPEPVLKVEPKKYFPKDFRQAIILREIIGPPKA